MLFPLWGCGGDSSIYCPLSVWLCSLISHTPPRQCFPDIFDLREALTTSKGNSSVTKNLKLLPVYILMPSDIAIFVSNLISMFQFILKLIMPNAHSESEYFDVSLVQKFCLNFLYIVVRQSVKIWISFESLISLIFWCQSRPNFLN